MQCSSNPFVNLEHLSNSTDYQKRQVGFCAEWTLDNICKAIFSPKVVYF